MVSTCPLATTIYDGSILQSLEVSGVARRRAFVLILNQMERQIRKPSGPPPGMFPEKELAAIIARHGTWTI